MMILTIMIQLDYNAQNIDCYNLHMKVSEDRIFHSTFFDNFLYIYNHFFTFLSRIIQNVLPVTNKKCKLKPAV